MIITRFSEIRGNLSTLLSRPLNLHSIQILYQSLRELRLLRECWFKTEIHSIKPIVKKEKKGLIPSGNESFRIIPIIVEPPAYSAERYMPYRILWAKVIVRAAYDYALWKDAKDLRLKKFADDAERWLFEPSDLELSFENICFAFDFPVDQIRQRTRILTRDDVKKLEFRERQSRSDLSGEFANGDSK